MADIKKLPASELCALAEKWIERLKASNGRDLPMRFFATKDPEIMPDPLDVFRELVERVKGDDVGVDKLMEMWTECISASEDGLPVEIAEAITNVVSKYMNLITAVYRLTQRPLNSNQKK